MNLFKRIVTTVHSSVDKTVANMENHEAIVDAALKESRDSLVRAKVRLARLTKDGNRQQNRVTELSSEIDLWAERARNTANNDRQKALSCLQRKKQREQELLSAREQLDEHKKIIKRVQNNVDESANRIDTLQRQRNHMRSREAAAQVGNLVHTLDNRMGDDIENAIERWEVKVGQSEIMNDTYIDDHIPADDLAAQFTSEEENQRLEAELDAMMNKEDTNHE